MDNCMIVIYIYGRKKALQDVIYSVGKGEAGSVYIAKLS